MSKERLEEIKQEVELLRDDMCVTSIEVDTSADAILDDMNWLIERVQELEEVIVRTPLISSFSLELMELRGDNKRYREALEKIASCDNVLTIYDAVNKARQALDGVEE